MFTLLTTCFLTAVLAPWVHRKVPRHAGALLALVPAAVFAWLILQLPQVAQGHSMEQSFHWVEGIDLEFALRLGGLGLLFALLISGIGTLIIFYTQGYFKGHPHQGRSWPSAKAYSNACSPTAPFPPLARW